MRYSRPAKIRFNRVLRLIEVEAADLETAAEQKLAIGPFSKHNGLMMDEFEAELELEVMAGQSLKIPAPAKFEEFARARACPRSGLLADVVRTELLTMAGPTGISLLPSLREI